MMRAVKIRIYPTDEQQIALSKAFGCSRWFWNNSLAETNRLYAETGKGLSRRGMNDRLPGLKKEFPWLADTYSQVLQSVSLNLSRAFINFFEGRAKFPRFKSKQGKQSIQYPQNVKITEAGLKVPKIGIVKAKVHRVLNGKLKTVTISMTPAGQYFASLLFDNGQPQPQASSDGKAVGIDLGLTHFAITSDGSKFANPRTLKQYERNLKRKQQKLSRKEKGSNRRQKARRLVARVQEKIANTRYDFLHKLSRKLVDENQVIIVENLAVKNMVKNHNLAKAISDVSWGTFTQYLKYKASDEGKVYLEVDRFFPSSKTCSVCLHQVGSLPLDVRTWTCSHCGTQHDRDINAAINIREEGLRILALGTRATASGGKVRPKAGRRKSTASKALPVEAGNPHFNDRSASARRK